MPSLSCHNQEIKLRRVCQRGDSWTLPLRSRSSWWRTRRLEDDASRMGMHLQKTVSLNLLHCVFMTEQLSGVVQKSSFPGGVIGRLSASACMSHREGNSMGGPRNPKPMNCIPSERHNTPSGWWSIHGREITKQAVNDTSCRWLPSTRCVNSRIELRLGLFSCNCWVI